MIRSTRALTSALFLATLLVAAPVAHAIPALQLYSPDAVYDENLETWVLTEGTFELWVVGDVGNKGSIYDVFLAGSYYGTSGNVTLTIDGQEVQLANQADYEAAAATTTSRIMRSTRAPTATRSGRWAISPAPPT